MIVDRLASFQGLHKRVKDAIDDAPACRPAYISTELRLSEQEEWVNDVKAATGFGVDNRNFAIFIFVNGQPGQLPQIFLTFIIIHHTLQLICICNIISIPAFVQAMRDVAKRHEHLTTIKGLSILALHVLVHVQAMMGE